jgi:hypothetical protein
MAGADKDYWALREAVLALYGMDDATRAEILRLGRRHAGGTRWTSEQLLDLVLQKVEEGSGGGGRICRW